jgi:hypothetical protein
MKTKVYRTQVENQEELLERIMVTAEEIRQNTEEFLHLCADEWKHALEKMVATLNTCFDFFLFISF